MEHKNALTHGHSWPPTPTYRTWSTMVTRCTNPRVSHYSRYGGRGITVCERWKNFANFLADMGLRPEGRTIDRINNNGNYEPSNCRWATLSEQQKNCRRRRAFCRVRAKGYHFSKKLGKFVAYINWGGERIHLGVFTEIGAAQAARKKIMTALTGTIK